MNNKWQALKGYLESLKDFSNHTDSYVERLFSKYIPEFEATFEPTPSPANAELVEALKEIKYKIQYYANESYWREPYSLSEVAKVQFDSARDGWEEAKDALKIIDEALSALPANQTGEI